MAFQSLILDMSGNVGTQSLAVTIRVLLDENLQKLINCKQIDSTENYKCTKCIDNYVLLWEKDSAIPKCVSINFIYSLNNEVNSNCQIFKNYGTIEQPKYKCEKCLNEDDDENIIYTKINNKLFETSFCEDSNKYDILKNCKEANMDIINKEIKISCTKCIKNYNLILDKNSHFCAKYNLFTFETIL